MTLSSSQPSQKSFLSSSNSSSSKTFLSASGSSSKKAFNKPLNQSISGPNITAGAFGFDDMFSGQAYGDMDTEYGGIEHFRNRTLPAGQH